MIRQISDQLSDRPVDNFTREYFAELVRFLEDPYNYTVESDKHPPWFKGIIAGGKESGERSDD